MIITAFSERSYHLSEHTEAPIDVMSLLFLWAGRASLAKLTRLKRNLTISRNRPSILYSYPLAFIMIYLFCYAVLSWSDPWRYTWRSKVWIFFAESKRSLWFGKKISDLQVALDRSSLIYRTCSESLPQSLVKTTSNRTTFHSEWFTGSSLPIR